MKIVNAGRGIHTREIKGVNRFKNDLPASWYGFTNLDLVLGARKAREIDVIIVAERRIYLVDIKDWYGQISSADGRWHLNGAEKDASPNTSPAASTMTGPLSNPTRATSSGRLAAALRALSSSSARSVGELLQHVAAKPGHCIRRLIEIGEGPPPAARVCASPHRPGRHGVGTGSPLSDP
jgi:hypothetical protein